MGFCQWAEMGPKVGQKWVFGCILGAKVGQNASKPTFAPTLNPFRHIHENPLFTQFKGGRDCFPKRALRQSRPSIKQGVCGICMARTCEDARHANDTNAFTLFVVSKSRLIASSASHLLVTVKNVPPIWVPPAKCSSGPSSPPCPTYVDCFNPPKKLTPTCTNLGSPEWFVQQFIGSVSWSSLP